jgi:pantetheine-phosphate adenylyltransferase
MHIALYAGIFDPITLGHLSLIDRGSRLFDRLWVVVAVNPDKQPLFSIEERVRMIREVTARWSNVECTSTEGYVVQLARELSAQYLVRGVRSSTDVEGEIALANMNRELSPDVETVFVPAHPDLSEVSSSRLKELALQGIDVSRYCPAEVAARLRERLAAGPSRTELARV